MRNRADVRLLVFRLGDLTCAAELVRVREVLPTQAPTRVPGAPPAVAGLINVRGVLVPLFDGRRALGQSPTSDGAIMLVEIAGRPVGFAVDEVVDLVTLGGGEWAERSELPGVDPRAVRGVGRRDGQSFVVLDLDALLVPLLQPENRKPDAQTPSGSSG